MEFSDQAARLRRWNITRPVRATDIEVLQRFGRQVSVLPSAVDSSLPALTQAMLKNGWGWSWIDADWSVLVTGDGGPHNVLKLRDDLDMSVVTASLRRYYDESGPADRPVYALDLAKATAGVPFTSTVTVLPAKHLLVSGPAPAPFLAAIDGKTASMSTDPTVPTLTAATGPAEYTMVRIGGQVCTKLSGRVKDEVSTLIGHEPLAAPTALALAVKDNTHGVVVVRYADPATAATEQPRRTALLSKGRSPLTQQPYTKVLGPVMIQAGGPNLTYRFDALPNPVRLSQMMANRDQPWAWC